MIAKKRIINVEKYLKQFSKGNRFKIGVNLDIKDFNISQEFVELKEDELIMPSFIYGIMSRRNALGEEIPLKDKPKVELYRSQYIEWTDWGGNTHGKYVDIPYKKYPRKKIPPKGYYFYRYKENNLEYLLINNTFTYIQDELEDIKFGINLTLEIFGKAEIFQIDLTNNKLLNEEKKYIHKNWEFLSPGEKLYDSLKKFSSKKQFSKTQYKLIQERENFLDSLEPDEKYKGTYGFSNYIAFTFPEENITILDSIQYGNATYVFDNNWEEVSKLTKSKILQKNLSKARIIHDNKWKQNIKNLFSERY